MKSLRVIAALIASTVLSAARAQVPLPFNDIYHGSWTVRSGVPAGLWQAKQSRDGFLWLASETGLFRFDGISFTKYRPPGNRKLLKDGPVIALTPTTDGGLWVAYRFGGASFIRGNEVTNYPASAIFPDSIFAFVEDFDGHVWAGTSIGLFRFDGTSWAMVDESWGHFAHTEHLKLSEEGDLWVDDGKTYYRLPRGSHQFQPTGLPHGKLELASRTTGWLSIDDVGLFPVTRTTQGTWSLGKQLLQQNISSLAHTPDGSLWFGAHDGIYRLRNNSLQSLRGSNGLSANFVYGLTVDREGSIWAITPNGLDQFRRTRFTSVPLPMDLQHPYLIDEGDSVLLGTGFRSSSLLTRISARGVETIPTPELSSGIHQIFREPNGLVWINSGGRLWTLSGTRLTAVTGPAEIPVGELDTRAMTSDQAGNLWIAVRSHGAEEIYTRRASQWTRFRTLDRIPRFVAVGMWSDHLGRLWITTSASRIYVIDRDNVRAYDSKDGFDAGGVTLLDDAGDHIWIGGAENLNYFQQGRFRRIAYEDGSAVFGVTGIAETRGGDIWLNCARGIVRIAAAQLHEALQQSQPRVKAQPFNYLDGQFETPMVLAQASTIAHTRDGRIYFLGRQGVVWTDESVPPANNIPPDVFVTSAVVDGHTVDDPSQLKLPSGAQNLQINYTATSLLVPERVRFRYQLEGFDKSWQDVGTRRQAFYTQLPPGRYTFHVMASNNDGVWSKKAASAEVYLAPTFLQSIEFRMLAILLALLCLGGLYWLRIRLLTTQIRNRLYERLQERERIARDLHDTFFQSIQGLFLRINTATKMLPEKEHARTILLDALEKSDRVMAEGRELVLDLRADDDRVQSLPEALANLRQLEGTTSEPDYKVFSTGQVRTLHPVCGSELLQIGREAVQNAFKHAQAAAIEVELLYERDFLLMRIRDDGRGIDEEVARLGRRPGHLGLIAMNERATHIGARYRLLSKRGRGTEIEVEVPARIAYAVRG